MSIYSGFATRTQENYYDQVLYNVISTLLTRIAKFYRQEDLDEGSFLKIISNQEKTLRKLEKRKYLEPKYAQLLQYFLTAIRDEPTDARKKDMNRTMSVLDRQFHQIRDTNERLMQNDKPDAHSLSKIDEKVRRSRKKNKSKKHSLKSHMDIFEFKAEKKMPELPSLQPLEHLLTRTKFNTKVEYSEQNSRLISDAESDEEPRKSEKKAALSKPPKFRAKMFFRQN